MVPRLIVGNLDCESEWASVRPRLPHAVRRRIAALSTLLRVFAGPKDRLWTLEQVDPARMHDHTGLARPSLLSGPLARLEPSPKVLAWGETRSIAQVRRGGEESLPSCSPGAPSGDLRWQPPPPRIVAHLADRGEQLALARRLDLALAGATAVRGRAEVSDAIQRASCERWVLKAPYSAASRDRLLGRGQQPTRSNERQIARLLERFGMLVFEPWADRLIDFSCCALADSSGITILGLQEQCVHRTGGFRGIVVWKTPSFIATNEREAVEHAAHAIGSALHRAGFRGPFGIDGWCYRDRNGRRRVHAAGEINLRLTFGWIARGLASHLWNSEATSCESLR
jgi:hypothetical protein